MKTHHILGAMLLLPVAFSMSAPRIAYAQEIETAASSQLASVPLPSGAARISGESVPKEITEALKSLIDAGGERVRGGKTEVLAWSGGDFKKSRIPALQTNLTKALQRAGWTYEETAPDAKSKDLTLFTVMRTSPSRRALIGFWASSDEALVLAWREMLPAATDTAPPEAIDTPTKAPTVDTPTSAGAVTLQLQGLQRQVNVMKGTAPPKPKFPQVAPKPGFVRGYVEDWTGKPLQGAVIGVRSTAAGGFYSGAQAKTDARGYYEIQVPWGVASFYCAGYTVDWGDEGRAALGLGAADGEADQFASAQGAVENWVLLPYGIADRDAVSDQPQYSGNYFGGSLSVSTSVGDDPNSTFELPVGATIELSLVPSGTLFDGSQGRSFLIRRPLEYAGSLFYINNIPLGQYKISAKLLRDGQSSPIVVKETGPYARESFGLDPKETRGEATLTFRPGGAKAEMATANRGNWNSLNISLYR